MSENPYNRLDKNGLLYTIQRFKNLFVEKVSGKGLSSNDYTNDEKNKLAGIANGATANVGTVTGATMNGSAVGQDANGVLNFGTVVTDVSGKANLNSPEFTGVPTVPTAQTSTDSQQIASTAFVKAAIAAALSGKIDLQFLFLDELPSTGVVGTFYFIPASSSQTGVDEWEEYVWDAANERFERVGSATVDLSNYFNTTNLPAITNDEIDTLFSTPSGS